MPFWERFIGGGKENNEIPVPKPDSEPVQAVEAEKIPGKGRIVDRVKATLDQKKKAFNREVGFRISGSPATARALAWGGMIVLSLVVGTLSHESIAQAASDIGNIDFGGLMHSSADAGQHVNALNDLGHHVAHHFDQITNDGADAVSNVIPNPVDHGHPGVVPGVTNPDVTHGGGSPDLTGTHGQPVTTHESTGHYFYEKASSVKGTGGGGPVDFDKFKETGNIDLKATSFPKGQLNPEATPFPENQLHPVSKHPFSDNMFHQESGKSYPSVEDVQQRASQSDGTVQLSTESGHTAAKELSEVAKNPGEFKVQELGSSETGHQAAKELSSVAANPEKYSSPQQLSEVTGNPEKYSTPHQLGATAKPQIKKLG